MSRTDRVARTVDAPIDRTFAALVERRALEAWLAPRGMTAEFTHFDMRAGGGYRLVLRYDDPATNPGKAGDGRDIVEARVTAITPGTEVVQAIDFASDDPTMAGTMTMTWRVTPVADRSTLVEFIADDVPDGISAADHARGMEDSLHQLATHLAT